MTTNAPFTVERSDCRIGDRIGYRYRFIFQGDRPEGEATILFDPVGYYNACPPMAERFRELGLGPDQIVAQVNEFYPNGKGIPDDSPLMGQGVGKAALEILVEDARERGGRVMHVFSTGRPGMVQFMARHGFETYAPQAREGDACPRYRLASRLL